MASKIAGKILDAATECFAGSGFHGCTTKEISDRADCTEGSLFRLFGSKEQLFEAALRRAFESGRMPNAEIARILENDDNFERGLRKAMLEFFDQLGDCYIRITMFACLERPNLFGQLIDASSAKIVAHTIEREIYRGNLRDDIDPYTAARALVMGLWYYAFVTRIASPEIKAKSKEARRAAVKNFVEIWMHGMKKPEPKPTRKAA